ncbi:hypothetical protein AB4Z22_45745, partial [Paenibacillus sp. TAF58]
MSETLRRPATRGTCAERPGEGVRPVAVAKIARVLQRRIPELTRSEQEAGSMYSCPPNWDLCPALPGRN